MKIFLTIVGAVMILLGGTWVLQGLGIMPGTIMSGHIQWTGYGSLLIAAGAAVLILASRRKKAV